MGLAQLRTGGGAAVASALRRALGVLWLADALVKILIPFGDRAADQWYEQIMTAETGPPGLHHFLAWEASLFADHPVPVVAARGRRAGHRIVAGHPAGQPPGAGRLGRLGARRVGGGRGGGRAARRGVVGADGLPGRGAAVHPCCRRPVPGPPAAG